MPNATLAAPEWARGVVLLIGTGEGLQATRSAWLIKADKFGNQLVKRALDTGENGLNMVYFPSAFGGDLTRFRATLHSTGASDYAWSQNVTQSDGLNHQGALR